MEAAKGVDRLIWSLIILEFLSFPCSAHGINCTVTQSDVGTKYSVPKFNATNCEYSWTNSSDHVLASHAGKLHKLVLEKNNWSLITNQCVHNISYVRSCTNEDTRIEAKCTTSCSGNVENQDGKGVSVAGTTRNHWIIPTFVGVGIFVMLLVIFLCYRKHQCRTPMIRNLRPNVADEEAQL